MSCRYLMLALISITLLAACGPTPEQIASQTAAAQTAIAAAWTATPTATATPTSTPTPTPTLTPTITPTPLGGGRIYFIGTAAIYAINPDGSGKTLLKDFFPAGITSASLSPDGTQILFSSYADENWNIYIIGTDGRRLRQLTNQPTEEDEALWSPDGSRIALASRASWDKPGELYVMGAEGGESTLVDGTLGRGSNTFAWSPDGTHIAYLSGSFPFTLYITDPDGSNHIRIADRVDSFTWSPDGAQIAYGRYGQFSISVANADGSGSRLLTQGIFARFPVWSPNDQHIAFQSILGDLVYVINADGSNPVVVLRKDISAGGPNEYAWSPDGMRIAVAFNRDEGYYINLIDSDGSNLISFHDHFEEIGYPFFLFWSPDGTRFAVVGGAGQGNMEIYVGRSDGGALAPLTPEPGYYELIGWR